MTKTIFDSLTKKQKEQFEIFSTLLIERGKTFNLTAIKEPEQIKNRHFYDSLAAIDILKDYYARISHSPFLIDIGSGAGLPVLALAIALPDWNFVSLEATGKKVRFQLEVLESAGINNVEVLSERAEELGKDEEYRERFDIAAARAVGNLSLTAELACPFIRKGGFFLTWKGAKLEQELYEGEKTLKIMGMDKALQTPYTTDENQMSQCRLVYAKKIGKTARKYPREFKEIKKSPPNFS